VFLVHEDVEAVATEVHEARLLTNLLARAEQGWHAFTEVSDPMPVEFCERSFVDDVPDFRWKPV